jgi:uncharacterized protein
LLMLTPVALLVISRRLWDAWPVLGVMWAMIWNMCLAALVVVAGVVGVLTWLWSKRKRPTESLANDTADSKLSRRDLLARATMAAPFVVSAASVGAGLRQTGRFQIRRIELKLPRLPDRLRGLTITHLSDMHVGRLFRPEHLPAMIDAVNSLKSDLVVVTGDLIDHSNQFLPAASDAIAQLNPGYARVVIAGNHDLIDSPREFLSHFRERERHFLLDESIEVDIGGEKILIAGLFWSRSDEPIGRDPGHAGRVRRALAERHPDRFTIGLAHHPHAFDAFADWNTDLTLAGHTHGGQIMLTPPGFPYPIGAGSVMFRYVWGIYRRGHSVMNVTSGVGNWFPVRINAPAEIVQLQLI